MRLEVSTTVPSQVVYKVTVPSKLMLSPNPGWPGGKIEVWPRETQLLVDYYAMVVSSLCKHEWGKVLSVVVLVLSEPDLRFLGIEPRPKPG